MAKRNVKVQYDTDTSQLEFKASNGDKFNGINDDIEAACAADKAIGQAITTAITAALTAALGEGGAIKTAVDAAIAVHAGG